MIDVLGRDLDCARRILEAEGFQIEVKETRTPRPVALSGPLRVVRQRQDGRVVRLVVTRERYAPAAGATGA
ncbi:MAG: aliphatic sulfonate ABC transporter [Armatimonadota bacterium]|nr:aliphatic sulfonate ABC transporter [Armatimonadota bacterium]